jgi:hypothetical protein
MKRFILSHKTLLIELLFKLRVLISISFLLGIDLGLSLNDDDNIESNKIKTSESISTPTSTSTSTSNDNDNNNVPVTATPSTSTIPISTSNNNNIESEFNIEEKINYIERNNVKVEENNSTNIDNSSWQLTKNTNETSTNNIDIEKEKAKWSSIIDKTNLGFTSTWGIVSASIAFKAPTNTSKLAFGTAAALSTGLIAGSLDHMKYKILDNIEDLANNRPPSPGAIATSEFNLIDVHSFTNKILELMKEIQNLDIDSQIILSCAMILLISFIYLGYIVSFIIAPSIFDAIKDHLHIRIKEFLIKFININRKLSVPFVILSFLLLVFSILFVFVILVGLVILNNLNPLVIYNSICLSIYLYLHSC